MRIAVRIPAILLSTVCVFFYSCRFSDEKDTNPSRTSHQAKQTTTSALYQQWMKLAGKTGFRPYPENPIIKPGKNGQWDSWAIGSMSVVEVGDTFHLYYEAGASGPADLQIGHASSDNGLHWTKDPDNPVIRPGTPGQWDDGATWDPFVLYENGIFKMWYGGEREGHRDFQCGYATSRDGKNFIKKGRISNFPSGDIGDMHLAHDREKGLYYMFYWDRRYSGLQRLRLAVSKNETDFNFEDSVPVSVRQEQIGLRYTYVFRNKGSWYMFYGFEAKPRIGFAASADLLYWSPLNKDLMPGEDAEILMPAENLFFMFYGPEAYTEIDQEKGGSDIRLAIYTGNLKDLASKD